MSENGSYSWSSLLYERNLHISTGKRHRQTECSKSSCDCVDCGIIAPFYTADLCFLNALPVDPGSYFVPYVLF